MFQENFPISAFVGANMFDETFGFLNDAQYFSLVLRQVFFCGVFCGVSVGFLWGFL